MRLLGTLLVLVLLAAMVLAAGYGVWWGYKLLSVQWSVLSQDWKAGLIIVGSILFLCALFISASIGSFIRRYTPASIGKVTAYNEFVSWYSELKNSNPETLDAASFRRIGNQLALWGNRYVVKQSRLLSDLLAGEKPSPEDALKKADGLYLEIRRDIGQRGAQVDRQIS